uniref:Uncharacterized protein n=1 Tax=Vitis vinifera TaxID=29760 RepID=F6HMZ1_VITVI
MEELHHYYNEEIN